MTTSDESERRLAEALRARSTGAGRSGPTFAGPAPSGMTTRVALVLALLAGAVLGMLLALLSLLVPGLLPVLG